MGGTIQLDVAALPQVQDALSFIFCAQVGEHLYVLRVTVTRGVVVKHVLLLFALLFNLPALARKAAVTGKVAALPLAPEGAVDPKGGRRLQRVV